MVVKPEELGDLLQAAHPADKKVVVVLRHKVVRERVNAKV